MLYWFTQKSSPFHRNLAFILINNKPCLYLPSICYITFEDVLVFPATGPCYL